MRIRRAALALLACSLTGCIASVRTLPGPPAVAIQQADGGSVRIATRQGDTLRLVHARVAGDSVVGTALSGSGNRMAVPLDDVESVAAIDADARPAVIVLGATAGLALLAIYALSHLVMIRD